MLSPAHSPPIPRPRPLPRCMTIDKAVHLRNETCLLELETTPLSTLVPVSVTVDDISAPPVHLKDNDIVDRASFFKATRLASAALSGLYKRLAKVFRFNRRSAPAPVTPRVHQMPRCLISDKAIQLRNESCVIDTPMEQESEQLVDLDWAMLTATPFRPISTYTLPCLAPFGRGSGVAQICGFVEPPTLVAMLDADVREQARLIVSQRVKEIPRLLLMHVPYRPLFAPSVTRVLESTHINASYRLGIYRAAFVFTVLIWLYLQLRIFFEGVVNYLPLWLPVKLVLKGWWEGARFRRRTDVAAEVCFAHSHILRDAYYLPRL